MKKLNPPIDIDSKKILAEIITAKKISKSASVISFLNSEKLRIDTRFDEYTSKFTALELVQISDSPYPKGREELISCYNSGGKNLKDLKDKIRSKQTQFDNEKCMYCRIKDNDTFDHYLPKDIFPEFSPLALNLIPCCNTCNKKKSEYWKENNERGIINFYLDDIPNEQFLFAGILIDKKNNQNIKVRFFIKNVNNIPTALYSTIDKHYCKLGLLKRYDSASNSAISELKRTLNTFGKELSLKSKKNALVELSEQLSIDYGVNYWKAILWRAISDIDDFFI